MAEPALARAPWRECGKRRERHRAIVGRAPGGRRGARRRRAAQRGRGPAIPRARKMVLAPRRSWRSTVRGTWPTVGSRSTSMIRRRALRARRCVWCDITLQPHSERVASLSPPLRIKATRRGDQHALQRLAVSVSTLALCRLSPSDAESLLVPDGDGSIEHHMPNAAHVLGRVDGTGGQAAEADQLIEVRAPMLEETPKPVNGTTRADHGRGLLGVSRHPGQSGTKILPPANFFRRKSS
jgi:hypothetical protein